MIACFRQGIGNAQTTKLCCIHAQCEKSQSTCSELRLHIKAFSNVDSYDIYPKRIRVDGSLHWSTKLVKMQWICMHCRPNGHLHNRTLTQTPLNWFQTSNMEKQVYAITGNMLASRNKYLNVFGDVCIMIKRKIIIRGKKKGKWKKKIIN